MAKGKFAPWITEDGLLQIEGWARDGLIDEQIAKNIGISRTTFYEWVKRFPNIADALKKGRAPVDIEVENALLNCALGFIKTVRKPFKVKKKTRYPDGKVEETEIIEYADEDEYIPPNTTAQIYWLKNRKPDDWRDKPVVEETKQTVEVTYTPEADDIMG